MSTEQNGSCNHRLQGWSTKSNKHWLIEHVADMFLLHVLCLRQGRPSVTYFTCFKQTHTHQLNCTSSIPSFPALFSCCKSQCWSDNNKDRHNWVHGIFQPTTESSAQQTLVDEAVELFRPRCTSRQSGHRFWSFDWRCSHCWIHHFINFSFLTAMPYRFSGYCRYLATSLQQECCVQRWCTFLIDCLL